VWNLFENFKDFNSSRRSCVIEHEHGSCGTVAPIIRSVPEMRELLDHHRATGQTIGLIGTSGGLHEGHLSLVRRSVEANDITVLWLFTGSSGLVEAGTVPAYVRNY